MDMKASGNQICTLCHLTPATMFCNCASIFLCDTCFIPHKNKALAVVHEISLVSSTAQDPATSELQGNLEAIDRCCSELTQAFALLTSTANEHLNKKLEELGTLRAVIQRDMEEAQCQRGPLASWFRNYSPGSLRLFDFSVETSQIDSFLNSLVKYRSFEPGSSAAPLASPASVEPLQANVTAGTLVFIRPNSLSPVVALESALRLSEGSRWVVLDSERVFVCGGGNREL